MYKSHTQKETIDIISVPSEQNTLLFQDTDIRSFYFHWNFIGIIIDIFIIR